MPSVPHLALALLVALRLASAAAEAQRPTYDFHNGFWLNLHHFLYSQARVEPHDRALQTDEESWNGALAYYKATLTSRDFLFDPGMRRMDEVLGGVNERGDLDTAELDDDLKQVLRGAAPVYRRNFWPEHEHATAAWISNVRPLLEKHGGAVTRRLAELFGAEWPADPIRVDVLVYANWAGAYTSSDPDHIRVGTLFPQQESPVDAFETLIHESSHLILGGRGGPINERIAIECERHGIEVPRTLWHAILFYTTGELVRRSPATPGNYVPYAHRHGLYDRGDWKRYRQPLERHWSAYLDGKRDLDSAIAGIIELLAAEASPD